MLAQMFRNVRALFSLFVLSSLCFNSQCILKKSELEIIETVRNWADEISSDLTYLQLLTRQDKVKESFANTAVKGEDWNMVIENVSVNIREMMQEKVDSVKAIKKHAELLSFYRKVPINMHSSYDYYDANNLTNTEEVEDRSKDRLESERTWKCIIPEDETLCYNENHYQSDAAYNPTEYQSKAYDNQFYEQYKPNQYKDDYLKKYSNFEEYDTLDESYNNFNYKRQTDKLYHDNNLSRARCANIAFFDRPLKYFRSMEMRYNPHFETEVNLNYSAIKVTPSVHARGPDVLNDIRWSEGLDLTFKCNFEKDPTLTYQYFGSPKGFVRFYPAMAWSDEEYDQTFEFRIRSWYLEAVTSAKDIIILLDRSGSMKGNKRLIATQIVNDILDTLTDNDYVNIYTFTNTTESLVNCFNDTLVQANEENLRLLREQLTSIDDKFYGDISLGFEKAFPILWKYREARRGALVCNQAIMLITEGLDYEYKDVLFKIYNHIPSEKYYRPIRVFTYLLGTEQMDAQRMKWIACANMGYFVNITVMDEVREKVLKYLEVMSRPINLSPEVEAEPAWTALYVHLADRRLSNWLWKINEGNRQRETYRAYARQSENQTQNNTQFTRDDDHPYARYIDLPDYKYLTSVSLPVYDLRPNQSTLLGVAGVDVPLDYIKQLTEPHRIGVNGYAFIITNNGYVLHHPDHRQEFKDRILKPTFNRVDFTEVEISDDTIESRKFDKDIIELRENIVLQRKGNRALNVRTPIDDMRRVILSKRHYYYTKIGPFSLVIALPDKYGFQVILHDTNANISVKNMCSKLKSSRHWRVHPKWLYTCKTHRAHKSPEDELLHFLNKFKPPPNCNTSLVESLLKDVNVTEWFETLDEPIVPGLKPYLKDGVVLTFLATQAGLTRYKNLKIPENFNFKRHFANVFNKAGDEVYYRRSAELNYDKPEVFIYSLPFEEYNENTTFVTASNVLFHIKHRKKAPIAAVGFQIYHKVLNKLLENLTCKTSKKCKISCVGSTWSCYVLDNDGYIILSNETQHLSKSIIDVDRILTKLLIRDGVYKEITLFDYQGTCYPNYSSKKKFYGPTAEDVRLNKYPKCDTPIKCKTIEYLKRQLQKTIPTPCDIEMKMYNSLWKGASNLDEPKSNLGCNCPYIAEPISGTNLLLVVVNGTCCVEESFDLDSEYPREIQYNLTLPCYIATMNNFTKRHYMKCIIKNEKEYIMNSDNTNCGGEGIVPVE